MKSNQSAKAMKTAPGQSNVICMEIILPEGIIAVHDDNHNQQAFLHHGGCCHRCHESVQGYLSKEDLESIKDVMERQEKVSHISTNLIDIAEALDDNESIVLDSLVDALATYYAENLYNGEEGDIEFLLSRVAEELTEYTDLIDDFLDMEDEENDEYDDEYEEECDKIFEVISSLLPGYLSSDDYNNLSMMIGLPLYGGSCRYIKLDLCEDGIEMTPCDAIPFSERK